MASLKVAVGTLIKKAFREDGTAGGDKIPFLPKSIARLIFLDTGESVEHHSQATDQHIAGMDTHLENIDNSIETLNQNLTQISEENLAINAETFDTMEEYTKALEEDESLKNKFCIVLEDAVKNDSYGDGTP